jgi:hypothetical protein
MLLFHRTKDRGKEIDLNLELDRAHAKTQTQRYNNQINYTNQFKHFQKPDIKKDLKSKMCNQIYR